MSGDAVADPAFDLEAYFDRIGFAGEAEPTLETLKALHLAQPLAIAFENLDVLLERPPSLSPADLQRKLVTEQRGGYCYELNGLFRAALEAIGFRVAALAARVRWMAPPNRITPRTHTALFVEIDGEAWLADVGFGGVVATAPLRLDTDEPQSTPHGLFRVTPRDGDLMVEFQTPSDERLPLYLLSFDPQAEIDLELANWFVATHPSSPFRTNLMAARVRPDGARLGLRNRRLTTRWPDGRVETADVERSAFASVLSAQFDLPFAWSPDLEPIFAGLPDEG